MHTSGAHPSVGARVLPQTGRHCPPGRRRSAARYLQRRANSSRGLRAPLVTTVFSSWSTSIDLWSIVNARLIERAWVARPCTLLLRLPPHARQLFLSAVGSRRLRSPFRLRSLGFFCPRGRQSRTRWPATGDVAVVYRQKWQFFFKLFFFVWVENFLEDFCGESGRAWLWFELIAFETL